MLPGAEFAHPLASRARLRMETARKAEHDCKEFAFAPAAPEAVRTRTGVGE
jgi:hypothetical protein